MVRLRLTGASTSVSARTVAMVPAFHSLPEGNIWDTYADLLTVPEDTDIREARPALVLREEVVQKLEEFDKYKPIRQDDLL